MFTSHFHGIQCKRYCLYPAPGIQPLITKVAAEGGWPYSGELQWLEWLLVAKQKYRLAAMENVYLGSEWKKLQWS